LRVLQNIAVLLGILFSFPAIAQIQCTVDVVIVEGATIEMCADAPQTISASNGFVDYGWTGPESLIGQTITPQFSGQYVVAALDGMGCISRDTIQVTINPNPTPTIISSEGNPICPGTGGTTLSLANPYATYDWGGGNTGPTLSVSGPGAYAVTVVDNNGCAGHQVISLTELTFDLTSTAASGCFGSTALLTASGGTSYLWSTNEVGNSIVVAPTVTTNYTVDITNGSCTQTLAIDVDPVQPLNYELEDTVFLGVNETYTFFAPTSGFVSFNWYPTEQIDNPNGASVTVTADSTFTLFMEATHSSGCIVKDSVQIVVVDLSIPNGFSPNGDPLNEFFVVPQLNYLDGSIKVWNRWGDLVFESDRYENNWDGTCQTAFCTGNQGLPEGTYFYHITVDDVSFKGYLTLKR